MSFKGSRHRIGDYTAYQRNLPHSPIRSGDTVIANGKQAVAVSKNYLKSTWVVRFADDQCDSFPESTLIPDTGQV